MSAAPRLRDETDDELMDRVRNDDTAAFAELYDRHAPTALAVARSVSHDSGQAEDAVQEGFLSIWRSRAGYQPREDSTFRGWAMKTVRNRAIDAHRVRRALKRPQVSPAALADSDGAGSLSAQDEVIEQEGRRDLESHLSRLPEAQAEVIALAFFGEMTHEEIAAELELPPGTVKGRIRLGMEKLRRGMAESA